MWDQLAKPASLGAVFTAACDEARRRGDRKVGTDHLLIGLLHDPVAADGLGVTVDDARAALADLDQDALARIGLDVRGLHLPSPPQRKRPSVGRNTLTSGGRQALADAVAANGGKARGLTPARLLRSLLTCASPEPAAQLLAQLGVDASAARDRVAQLET